MKTALPNLKKGDTLLFRNQTVSQQRTVNSPPQCGIGFWQAARYTNPCYTKPILYGINGDKGTWS